METSFELRDEDWLALGADYEKRAPPGQSSLSRQRAAMLFGGVTACLAAATAALLVGPCPAPLSLLFAFLAGMGAALSLLALRVWHATAPGTLLRQLRQAAAAGRGLDLFGERTVRLDADRVIEECVSHTRSLQWRRIAQVARTREHVFIYTALLPQLITAIVVPRRSFRSQEEFERFAVDAVERWRAAQP